MLRRMKTRFPLPQISHNAFSSQGVRRSHSRVEAGSNTSTVTLRVVGGDEKVSLESETVKYGHKSQGTRTQKSLRWRVPEAIQNGRPVLLSERTPNITRPSTL
jgi:hypothetical protein